MGSARSRSRQARLRVKARWSWRRVSAEAEEDSSPVQRGPIWGGAPGTGTRPQRVGGDGESAVSGTGATETQAAIDEGEKDKDNPLLRC